MVQSVSGRAAISSQVFFLDRAKHQRQCSQSVLHDFDPVLISNKMHKYWVCHLHFNISKLQYRHSSIHAHIHTEKSNGHSFGDQLYYRLYLQIRVFYRFSRNCHATDFLMWNLCPENKHILHVIHLSFVVTLRNCSITV